MGKILLESSGRILELDDEDLEFINRIGWLKGPSKEGVYTAQPILEKMIAKKGKELKSEKP